jgi:metal-responsive CopG/Arc/MetJ family transcriptional regulator
VASLLLDNNSIITYNDCMKSQTFNISMPAKLVQRIDSQTKKQGYSRSDFVRQAVRKQLATLEQWENLTDSVRGEYKGKDLSETEVAKIVSSQRS